MHPNESLDFTLFVTAHLLEDDPNFAAKIAAATEQVTRLTKGLAPFFVFA